MWAIMPSGKRASTDVLIKKVGAYMIGNILVSIVAGLASAALTGLGVPFAVPLAFLVAVFDLISMIVAAPGRVGAGRAGFGRQAERGSGLVAVAG